MTISTTNPNVNGKLERPVKQSALTFPQTCMKFMLQKQKQINRQLRSVFVSKKKKKMSSNTSKNVLVNHLEPENFKKERKKNTGRGTERNDSTLVCSMCKRV